MRNPRHARWHGEWRLPHSSLRTRHRALGENGLRATDARKMMPDDEWDGPPLMPASTYRTVQTYQIIHWPAWDGPSSNQAVIMRGALHCRILSRSDNRGTARRYATALLERYVRRLRITETDPVRWYNWLHRHLLRVARKRSWWESRWQYAVENDLRWLVCEYSVLIDGVRYDVYEPEHMQNVRKLACNARKYMGNLPELAVRGVLGRKMAINVR
jgi:hypothetical protein